MNPYILPGMPKEKKEPSTRQPVIKIRKPDSIEDLRDACCRVTGCTFAEFIKKGKKSHVIRAKQLFCWYAMQCYGGRYSLLTLGAYAGAHEHTTVIDRIQKSSRYYRAKDPVFLRDYENLLAILSDKTMEVTPEYVYRPPSKVRHQTTGEILSIKEGAMRMNMPYSQFHNTLNKRYHSLPYEFV